MGNIFGGGGQQASNSTTWSPPSWTVPLWQQAVGVNSNGSPTGYGAINTLWNMSQNPKDYVYGNKASQPLVAPQTGEANALINAQAENATNPWYLKSAGNVANNIATTPTDQLNPYSSMNNPALSGMISSADQDLQNQFTLGTGAAQNMADAQSGSFGGSASNEMRAMNARALGQAVGGVNSNIYNNAYNQAGNLTNANIQNQLGAANSLNQTNASENANIAAALGGQNQIQQNAQNVIGANQNLFNANTQMPLNLSSMLMGYLQQASGGGGTSASQQFGPAFTPGQGIGAGLLGLGALGSYMNQG